jgi:hypothetical protein
MDERETFGFIVSFPHQRSLPLAALIGLANFEMKNIAPQLRNRTPFEAANFS